MADKVLLKNRVTGEVEYPVTQKECVVDSQGNSVFDGYVTKNTFDEYKSITPYPKDNEIIYTTTDGEIIELNDSNIVSNIYYKDKGCGIITYKNNNNLNNVSFRDKHTLTRIIFPEGISKINAYIFCNCTNLRQVNIPEGVTSIGTAAFENTVIEHINLPSSLTGIGEAAFRGCEYLLSIIIPDGVTNISKWCFSGCKSLFNVTIPNGVTTILTTAFGSCHSLTKVILPPSLKEIGSSAFINCYSLKFINLYYVSTIGVSAFMGCYSLDNCTLGNGITNLNGAFCNCQNLRTVYLPSSITEINTTAFQRNEIHRGLLGVEKIDSAMSKIENFPAVNNLKTLILRYNGVVKDVDTYVSTFAVENPEPVETVPMSLDEEGIMPLTNLDTYIGTPNNWLKIYVPANRLAEYKETYPTLKKHFRPITGDMLTAEDVKEELESNYYNKKEATNILSENGLIGTNLIPNEETIVPVFGKEFELDVLEEKSWLTFKFDKGIYEVNDWSGNKVEEINNIIIKVSFTDESMMTINITPNTPALIQVPTSNFKVSIQNLQGKEITLHNFQIIKESKVITNEKNIQILKNDVADLKSEQSSGGVQDELRDYGERIERLEQSLEQILELLKE